MKTEAGSGLYIHVPFCRKKCPYCDFYSKTAKAGFSEWAEAAAAEARMYSDFNSAFVTVYVGGGTPTVLPAELLADLMRKLRLIWDIDNAFEITIEANPDDITGYKLDYYREMGFNRVSLGIQSFRDEELRFLGRRHDARSAEEAAEAVLKGGFDRVSFDLINSIPGQSLRDWEYTLEKAVRMDPDHLSCYQLTIKSGTPFAEMLSSGEIIEPGEVMRREMFLFTSEYLSSRGYEHYEISNFARSIEARSKHNSGYWGHRPYLGIGPSAHSFDGKSRWWNPSSMKEYLLKLENGLAPLEGSEKLSKSDLLLEKLFLGLRTSDGVDASVLEGYPGWEEGVRRLKELSLVEIRGRRLVPTIEGFLLADSLPLYFVV